MKQIFAFLWRIRLNFSISWDIHSLKVLEGEFDCHIRAESLDSEDWSSSELQITFYLTVADLRATTKILRKTVFISAITISSDLFTSYHCPWGRKVICILNHTRNKSIREKGFWIWNKTRAWTILCITGLSRFCNISSFCVSQMICLNTDQYFDYQ